MANSIYNQEVRREDTAHLVAASTHYLGHNIYALRCQEANGQTKNYLLDAPAFEHLRTMIESALLIGMGDLDTSGE